MNKPGRTSTTEPGAVRRVEKQGELEKGDPARSGSLGALRAALGGSGGDEQAQANALSTMPAQRQAATLRGVNLAPGNRQTGRLASGAVVAPVAPAPAPAPARRSGGKRVVQTKLRVSSRDDRLEREADELADALMEPREFTPPAGAGEDPGAGAEPDPAPPRWTHAPTVGQPFGLELPDAMEADLAALELGGDPLAASERSFFEARLGVDLADVRVHVGPQAVALCDALAARAFAFGRHVVLGADACASEPTAARRLMAHELVHVVQQGAAPRPAAPPAAAERAAGEGASAAVDPAPDLARGAEGPPGREAYAGDATATPSNFMPAAPRASRRHRRPIHGAATAVMRTPASDIETDTIKAIADPGTGTIHVVRVNKRGEIVAPLAEVAPPKGEKLDAKKVEADFNGRGVPGYAVTSAKITVPKKYIVRPNKRHDVQITRGTEAERKIDQMEEEAKNRRERVLAYFKEEYGRTVQLDADQIADITKTEGFKAWDSLDRSAAQQWLVETGSTDGKWLRTPGGMQTYFRPDQWDHRALTVASRDPEFLRWQRERAAQAKAEENSRILMQMRAYYKTDNLSLEDARKLYEGMRRDELHNFLGTPTPTGVTMEEADKLNPKQLMDAMETRGSARSSRRSCGTTFKGGPTRTSSAPRRPSPAACPTRSATPTASWSAMS